MTKKYFDKRLIMTSEYEQKYNDSKTCWICKQELNTGKVKDHLPVNLEVLYVIKLRIPRKLPIIFHNLQGYGRTHHF